MSNDRKLIATGQVGLCPLIYVWDAETAEYKNEIRMPKGSRAISSLAFSHDNKYLAAADMTDDHNVVVLDLAVDTSGSVKYSEAQVVSKEKTGGLKIFHI